MARSVPAAATTTIAPSATFAKRRTATALPADGAPCTPSSSAHKPPIQIPAAAKCAHCEPTAIARGHPPAAA